MDIYSVPFTALAITLADVCDAMGYGQSAPDAETERFISRLIPCFNDLQPCCCFRLFDGHVDKHTVEVGGEVFDTGATISAVMKGAGRFAVFVATAGQEYERRRESLKAQEDILGEYVMDAIGSVIAVKMGVYVETLLEQMLGNDSFTHHFSPGHCKWPVADQRKIFNLLGDEPCGVVLADSSLMYPVKSISGIIGIGEQVKRVQNNCDICPMVNCFRRNTSIHG